MSDYEDGKNVLRKRPQPGRPSNPLKEKVVEKVVEKEPQVDVNAIANAVVKAIGNKMPVVMHGGGSAGTGATVQDGFDNSKTLERLADSMSVHGSDSESNFGDLGKVKTTKKDEKDVQSTIDLLSNIDEGE
jgi:hypothetical protein